jgi:uncharacterized metal-binding protein
VYCGYADKPVFPQCRLETKVLINPDYIKKEEEMENTEKLFNLEVTSTESKCPIGEKIGSQNLEEGKIPVLSCEGACIRGEIARLAAHLVAKEETFRRGCHGELFGVPKSAMAEWVKKSGKVVLIDGCFLRCHGRILENLIEKNKLLQFDALSHYKKYTDRFEIDSVPEDERRDTARMVADIVLAELKKEGEYKTKPRIQKETETIPQGIAGCS